MDAGKDDLYNGAPVTLRTWQGWDSGNFEFYLNMQPHTQDEDTWSTGFDIRVGSAGLDTVGPNPGKWCLDGGDVDSDGSVLFIWECNGLPQQQFVLDYEFYASSQVTEMYWGQLRFLNGKCLDGTSPIAEGNAPIAWSCNGLDQQVWGTCEYTHRTGPPHLCGDGPETGPCVGMGSLTV